MDRSPGAEVVRRRLGTALRALRERANIRLDAAARMLECSPAKVSRVETGNGPIRAIEVRALLDLYEEHDPDRRARLERWASESKSSGWWADDADLTGALGIDRVQAFETAASRVHVWGTPVFPIILQTRDYAKLHARTVNPQLSDDDLERLIDLRLRRQQALLDPGTDFAVAAVLDESAIRRTLGSPEVLAAQHAWLADLVELFARQGRADLSVLILPQSAPVSALAISPFSIFIPREAELDPVTAFVEYPLGSAWFVDDETAPLVQLFSTISCQALTSQESLTLLRDAS
ncbi:MAG: helix-turn-helix domain-containing protein [Pseudonocardia sp.]